METILSLLIVMLVTAVFFDGIRRMEEKGVWRHA